MMSEIQGLTIPQSVEAAVDALLGQMSPDELGVVVRRLFQEVYRLDRQQAHFTFWEIEFWATQQATWAEEELD